MTRRVGSVLVSEPEKPRRCSACGALRECRPYGKDGADICHPCATATPESRAEMKRQFDKRLDGVTHVVDR
jgi:hypothetical protein